MKLETKCKMCGRKLELECDEDYSRLGDPHNLVKMVCCNHCYDSFSRRRTIEDRIFKVCVNLVQMGDKTRVVEKAKNMLRVLTQKYAAWCRDNARRERIIWDEEFVTMLFDHPDKWHKILTDYRRHCDILWRQHEQTTIPN